MHYLSRKESKGLRSIPRSAIASIFIQQGVLVPDGVKCCVSHWETATCERGITLARLNLERFPQKSIKIKWLIYLVLCDICGKWYCQVSLRLGFPKKLDFRKTMNICDEGFSKVRFSKKLEFRKTMNVCDEDFYNISCDQFED